MNGWEIVERRSDGRWYAVLAYIEGFVGGFREQSGSTPQLGGYLHAVLDCYTITLVLSAGEDVAGKSFG